MEALGSGSWLATFVEAAGEQARRRGDRSLAAAHLALGLARPEGAAHPLLTALGVDPLDWRDQIVGVLGWQEGASAQREGRPAGTLAESPDDLRYEGPLGRDRSALAVLELAAREAAANNHAVGPAHVLVALLLEADGGGGATGAWVGMTAGRVRAAAGLRNQRRVIAGGVPHVPRTRGHTAGPLVLCGGGAGPDLLAEVVALAGQRASRPRVALVDLGWHTRPTTAQRGAQLDRLRGAGAVDPADSGLTDRAAAASPAACAALAAADLVWFAGGDAAAIYDRLWATPALDAIEAANARGAVVAGQSAGATVWGAGTLSAYASLGDPEPFPLFGWIRDVVVFAHYAPQRERAFRGAGILRAGSVTAGSSDAGDLGIPRPAGRRVGGRHAGGDGRRMPGAGAGPAAARPPGSDG